MSLVKRIQVLDERTRNPCEELSPWNDVRWLLTAMLTVVLVAWHTFGFSYIRFDTPIVYSGDALYYQYLYQTVAEGGWYGLIERAGAPFGTTQFDFPNTDVVNLLIMRLAAMGGDSPFVAFNAFVLSSFPICAAIGYAVARRLGLAPAWAFVASVAFSILPYHFGRLGHLFLLSYFVAAIVLWLCVEVVPDRRAPGKAPVHRAMIALAVVVCGSCGIYYAFFSCFFILAAGLERSAHAGALRPLRRSAILCAIVVAAAIINLAPAIHYTLREGGNPEVAKRNAAESEHYGLKLTQLLLPQTGHRVETLRTLRSKYEQATPLSNENRTASLGILGALGFLALLSMPFLGRLRSFVPEIVERAVAPTYAGFLFATIGGFGSLFAFIVSPQLRAFNRISPFLACFGIFCAVLILSALLTRLRRAPRWAGIAAALALGAFVYFDQVSSGGESWQPHHAQLMQRFDADREYYTEVEHALGSDAMILQLPLMKYPESAPVMQLEAYQQLTGFLHTSRMRFTSGAMRGRPTERWQRLFESFPTKQKIKALSAIGFAGIDLDARGLGEDRASIIADLERHGMKKVVSSAEEQNVLLSVPNVKAPKYRALAVAPKSGWSIVESTPSEAWIWSFGNATLELANVTSESRACYLELMLESYLVPRTVSLWEGDKKLAEEKVGAMTATRLAAYLDAGSNPRTLSLRTDAPANSPTGDPRLLSYRLLMKEIPLCL